MTIKTPEKKTLKPGRKLTREQAQEKIIKRYGKAFEKLAKPDSES